MAHHCEYCGDRLTEEEAAREERLGKYVCDDCLHHGLTLLERGLGRILSGDEEVADDAAGERDDS